MLRILDVGSGHEGTAKGIFNLEDMKDWDYEIVNIDIDPEAKPDVVHDITKPLPLDLVGEFDLVLCSHVLEHIDRDKMDRTFGNITKALKNMGEIWVLVPSLEWAAAEVLSMNHTLPVEAHLYGMQNNPFQYHKVGFTLRMLRIMFESHNLLIKRAYQAPYIIRINDQNFQAIQNIAIGARYDGFENPGLHGVEAEVLPSQL